jgi:predicted ATPase
MIKSVKFEKDWRCFKSGDVIDFRPGINLLVGDQGCGKSSLLLMLKNDGFLSQEKIATVDAPKGTPTYFLDFEKGSVRGMDANSASSKGIGTMAVVANIMCSHGESVNAVLRSMPKTRNAVMLNDEPDMALSMRSIYNFYQMMENQVNNLQQQIIVSCHNPYLMELVGDVCSLEHRTWMTYQEFKKKMQAQG